VTNLRIIKMKVALVN